MLNAYLLDKRTFVCKSPFSIPVTKTSKEPFLCLKNKKYLRLEFSIISCPHSICNDIMVGKIIQMTARSLGQLSNLSLIDLNLLNHRRYYLAYQSLLSKKLANNYFSLDHTSIYLMPFLQALIYFVLNL